ncbi:MAG: hypothetical protein V5B30_05445 [Candidatus Accumulibacter delftensis]|jgi:hypothetical protein
MKDHYDFSKGVRGKFYASDAVVRLPVYLDEQVERVASLHVASDSVARQSKSAREVNEK